MLTRLAIQDIQTYLSDNDWRQSLTWRGAAVWSHTDGHEVLVPPRDDLADTDLRINELLEVLADVEHRPTDDIIMDISAPLDDLQSFRIFQEGMPSGLTPLGTGIRVLQSVRSMIGVTARTVAEGPLPVFPSGTSPIVGELVQHVRLGPSRPGSYVFAVRVPVHIPSRHAGIERLAEEHEPLGRQVSRQLYEAISAARAAAARSALDDLTAFEDTVTAGVSADLCTALSVLAGNQFKQAFEVGFRWSRGLSINPPADTVHFAEGNGVILRTAARHLKQVRISGPAEVSGLVVMLHNQAETIDRWRVKVRGDLNFKDSVGFGRTVWVQLGSQAVYDRAIAAHQADHLVRVSGQMSTARGRVELIANDAAFEVFG